MSRRVPTPRRACVVSPVRRERVIFRTHQGLCPNRSTDYHHPRAQRREAGASQSIQDGMFTNDTYRYSRRPGRTHVRQHCAQVCSSPLTASFLVTPAPHWSRLTLLGIKFFGSLAEIPCYPGVISCRSEPLKRYTPITDLLSASIIHHFLSLPGTGYIISSVSATGAQAAHIASKSAHAAHTPRVLAHSCAHIFHLPLSTAILTLNIYMHTYTISITHDSLKETSPVWVATGGEPSTQPTSPSNLYVQPGESCAAKGHSAVRAATYGTY